MIRSDYDATSHAGVAGYPTALSPSVRASALLASRAMPRIAAALILAAIAACGDRHEQELRSAASWSKTALVVARYWTEGQVPGAYARRALEKASQELAKGPLPDAAEPVDELRAAVERGDRDTARRLLQELSAR